MTKQTIANSNPETKPLYIIHVLGWDLGNTQDQEPELWPDLGFSCFDISSNIEIEPKEVIQKLEADILIAKADGKRVALVGHSIGGYYAAYMAEKFCLPFLLTHL